MGSGLTQEGLLNDLVGVRLGLVGGDSGRDVGEGWVGWVSEVVVVEHTGVSLLDELAVRAGRQCAA